MLKPAEAEHLPLQKPRGKCGGGGGGGDWLDHLKINPFCVLRISSVAAAHPRTWLLLAILSLQFLLLLSLRFLPVSLSRRLSPPPPPPPTTLRSSSDSGSSCGHGRVYVYDLPPMFNRELIDGCDSLDPWHSRCAALANGGFGPPAAAGLRHLVPEHLLPAWYWTDQFASELIYHRRILRHPCRTPDPAAAAAFYVPFYAGLAVGKYLWSYHTAKERDFHSESLLRWIREQEAWGMSGTGGGGDHFIVLGRITWDFRRSKDGDWGGGFLYMPGMENVTRLLIERNPWDARDVGVPYPTGFHPRTPADVLNWQGFVLNRTRNALFCFAGAARASFKDDFRSALLGQCAAAAAARGGTGGCRSVDCSGTRCSNNSAATMELFLDSEFCLQPRGDSFTRRSIFDCMLAGAIPVFFWRRSAYLQYAWHLPEDPASYSVFIDRRDVRNGTSIRAVLEGLGRERVRKMREKVVEYIPRFVYAFPEEGLDGVRDAFDVAVDGVLKRFRERKQENSP